MTILITGATGLVGFHIAKLIRTQKPDISIKCLIRSNKVYKDLLGLDIETIRGDLLNKESLKCALSGVETVYHAAAEVRENASSDAYYKTNVIGTRNLVESFVENDGKKFLNVSTAGVYGYRLPNLPVKEDYSVKIKHPYHTSKLKAENEVFKSAKEHGFFTSVIRPPMIVGPGDRHVAPAFFKMVISQKTIPLISGGKKSVMSFAHVKDVVQALVACGETNDASGEAFNVCSFAAAPKEIFDTVGKICGVMPKYRKIGYSTAYALGILSEFLSKIYGKKNPKITRRRIKQLGNTRMYDTTKIEKVVKFKPKFNMKKSLEHAYQWMKEEQLIEQWKQ